MVSLSSGNNFLTIALIVLIFLAIGAVVFFLRKKIPGLAEYKEENEDEIVNENLSRMLVDVEEVVEEKTEDGEDK